MAHKRVAIVQSSYIPWKGYFDLIRAADEFILLDDVQFTKRDWRSRNRIKTKDGLAWLTIPVHTKGRYLQTIAETTISDPSLVARVTGRRFSGAYARSAVLRGLRAARSRRCTNAPPSDRLSDVNRSLIDARVPGARHHDADHLVVRVSPARGTQRAPDRPVRARPGATDYLSGPSGARLHRRSGVCRAGVRCSSPTTAATPNTRSRIRRSSTPCRCSTSSSAPGPARVDYMKDVVRRRARAA